MIKKTIILPFVLIFLSHLTFCVPNQFDHTTAEAINFHIFHELSNDNLWRINAIVGLSFKENGEHSSSIQNTTICKDSTTLAPELCEKIKTLLSNCESERNRLAIEKKFFVQNISQESVKQESSDNFQDFTKHKNSNEFEKNAQLFLSTYRSIPFSHQMPSYTTMVYETDKLLSSEQPQSKA